MPSRMVARVLAVVAFVLLFLPGGMADAQPGKKAQVRNQLGVEPSRPPTKRDPLTVWLVTFGPGSHPFFKFGHNAIWIRDSRTKRDAVYNFGTFSFNKPGLIPKFVVGRFQYWLSRSGSMYFTMRSYERANRTVEVQELNLTPEQKVEISLALAENLKPENKHYKYDYYRDNCSTRVRDAIDEVLGGVIKEGTSGPGRLTYREHTSRLTYDLAWEYFVLNLVMGSLIDQPTTEWDEAFLPGMLQQQVRKLKVTGPSGSEEPLVLSEHVLFKADRPEELTDPPPWGIWFGVVGFATGGALAGLGRGGRTNRGLRALKGVLLALLGLFYGFFGIFCLAAWMFTDHEVGYDNENILLCAPWLIAMVVIGIGVARGKKRSLRRAFRLVGAGALLAALGVVLKILPWFDQANWPFIGLLLPTWVGGAVGLYFLAGKELALSRGPVEEDRPKKKTGKKKAGATKKKDAKESSEADAPASRNETTKRRKMPPIRDEDD